MAPASFRVGASEMCLVRSGGFSAKTDTVKTAADVQVVRLPAATHLCIYNIPSRPLAESYKQMIDRNSPGGPTNGPDEPALAKGQLPSSPAWCHASHALPPSCIIHRCRSPMSLPKCRAHCLYQHACLALSPLSLRLPLFLFPVHASSHVEHPRPPPETRAQDAKSAIPARPQACSDKGRMSAHPVKRLLCCLSALASRPPSSSSDTRVRPRT